MGSFGGYWEQFQPVTTQPALPVAQPTTTTQPVAQLPEGGSQPYAPGPTTTTTTQPATQPIAQPTGSDPQSTFMQIMQGLPATPENLAAKEQQLAAAGIYVHRNAEGVAGKVQIGQGGPIIDVIANAGLGGGGSWQWMGPGSGSGGSLGNFQVGNFTGGGQYPLSSVNGSGLGAPWLTPFNAPDPNSVTNDKALQWQMGRGMDAIQRSAASRGTLLTGGTLKKLDEFGQGLASTYYGDVYNRALGEYQMAHNIFEENQGNLYNRLFGVAGLGQNAAAQVGNSAGAYGAGASNTLLGQGNAQGAGTATGGAAWGNAFQNLGNIGASAYLNSRQPQPNNYGVAGSSYGSPYIPGTPVYGQNGQVPGWDV